MFVLLPIHILSGALALVSAAVALYCVKGKRTHILSGRIYFWSIVTIFLTAIPMSIASSNIFLFLIAIFSFYLAFAGMRFARNRNGVPNRSDWLAVFSMMASGIGMWILAAFCLANENSQSIVLIVFGFLEISIGYADYKSHKDESATGKPRIVKHLTNMLGGTIAVITAVLVVNPPFDPEWVWWILPTTAITPIIFWWNKKTLR